MLFEILLLLLFFVFVFWTVSSLSPTDTIKWNRLVGLVVKASASREEGPGFESCLRRDFFGVESYQ